MDYFANIVVLAKQGDLSDKLKRQTEWGDFSIFKSWQNEVICRTSENVRQNGLIYQHASVGKMGSFVGRFKTSVNQPNLPTFSSRWWYLVVHE